MIVLQPVGWVERKMRNYCIGRQMLGTYSFFPLGLDCQIQALIDEVVNPWEPYGV